ncbi:TetR/AcrR family transcriptional regulator [Trueperella sp. LYQ143]|uniref:TetR/AcrR family transcriptional regulator n=1 Tax=Trueperella sp. LYQ143 TaxID=3391059 RepID=UPI0039832D12
MSPKISAASVREHHEIVFHRIIDAAERILREDGPSALTASAVAKQAGMARNSIYRYVDTVDDLRIHVLERYIPAWVERLHAAIESAPESYERLRAVISLSLDIGAESGHQWLIDVMGTGRRSAFTMRSGAQLGAVMNFHHELARTIAKIWAHITPQHSDINARMTRTVLNTGLALIDDGHDVETVKQTTMRILASLANS